MHPRFDEAFRDPTKCSPAGFAGAPPQTVSHTTQPPCRQPFRPTRPAGAGRARSAGPIRHSFCPPEIHSLRSGFRPSDSRVVSFGRLWPGGGHCCVSSGDALRAAFTRRLACFLSFRMVGLMFVRRWRAGGWVAAGRVGFTGVGPAGGGVWSTRFGVRHVGAWRGPVCFRVTGFARHRHGNDVVHGPVNDTFTVHAARPRVEEKTGTRNNTGHPPSARSANHPTNLHPRTCRAQRCPAEGWTP